MRDEGEESYEFSVLSFELKENLQFKSHNSSFKTYASLIPPPSSLQ
jgi:hypothetical protein